MREVEGKVAFVTGSASGVGFGMAKAFAGAGMKVVLADIRRDAVEAAAGELGENVHALQVDVTDRDSLARAADEAERVFGKVHMVCNNAGVNLFNDIAEATYQDWDWIFGVNLGGVINGCVTFVPRIKSHGEGGHVVNTGSMASFIAGPGAGIYTAAKFGVRGVTEALRWSLLPHRIGVSLVCPGLVNSNIHASDEVRPPELSTDTTPADAAFMKVLPQVHQAGMSPEEIGQKVLRGVQRNDFYIFPHPEHRDELRAIFDEVIAAFPDEEPPPERLAFEEGRRSAAAAARAAWPDP
jgi:NAD(P)-dependent dehydrogenase (short-subunit alcohol dehydrogenase family)